MKRASQQPAQTAARGLLLAALAVTACDSSTSAPAPAGSAAPAGGKVDIVTIAGGSDPVSAIVAREAKRARDEGRDLVIYVGAEWCEPCKRFHEAAARGELDAQFPTLRLLEFDHDRDKNRLGAADCLTPMIPLFAKPTDDGRCDPQQRMMGSVKGPGAVANIAPRLKRMLGR